MNLVGEIAAEVDRLVVAMFSAAGASFSAGPEAQAFPAHPGLLLGVGAVLLHAPVPVESACVIFPYLPESLWEALIENNVDEGVVTVDGGHMALTDAGREAATAMSACFDQTAASLWDDPQALAELDEAASVVVAHACALEPPIRPSAFAITSPLVDRATPAARVFRSINAMRYWRADAHRAAWGGAGLSVLEAHALNRLWDLDRDVVRVGQGEERPGRRGVAALEERGWAADRAITDIGRKERLAIEAMTDAGTAPIYAPLDDGARRAFLEGLRQLPIN